MLTQQHESTPCNPEDTIVACATPAGHGGIAVVRLSGPEACSLVKQMADFSARPRYAEFVRLKGAEGEWIDEAIVIYFQAPHSFTGQDVVELQCHGAPCVVDHIIQTLLSLGARMAEPGEFSKIAYLNNRIDLIQAESIADLIAAKTKTAALSAVRSLHGDFSTMIHQLSDRVTKLRVLIEANLDFAEEDIDTVTSAHVTTQMTALQHELAALLIRAQDGQRLQEGCRVVLAGAPNAGKSSLLNRLLGNDVAIVTPMPGTTRDILSNQAVIAGIACELVDTAGLRDTDNVIEQEGVRRAKAAVQSADLILWVTDCCAPTQRIPDYVTSARASRLFVVNKIDLTTRPPGRIPTQPDRIHISAQTGAGCDALLALMQEYLEPPSDEGAFSARRRHIQALTSAQHCLDQAADTINEQVGLEISAEALRQAQSFLGEIVGEVHNDMLLDQIFSDFCIGK